MSRVTLVLINYYSGLWILHSEQIAKTVLIIFSTEAEAVAYKILLWFLEDFFYFGLLFVP